MRKQIMKAVCGVLVLLCGFAPAATVVDANTTPLPWGPTVDVLIGKDAAGSFSMDGGDTISSQGTYIGYNIGGNGTATIDGAGTKWTATSKFRIGQSGIGSLTVTGGAEMQSQHSTTVGYNAGSSGSVVISGSGSKLVGTAGDFIVGYNGRGSLDVINGGLVSHTGNFTICHPDNAAQAGTVLVQGTGSALKVTGNCTVARYGRGKMIIRNNGLVTVGGVLGMNLGGTLNGGSIRMSDSGQLALYGNGSANITAFFGLMNSSGDNFIKYWNGSAWDDIANATVNVDYTLQYITTGDLAGYTLLTVTAEGFNFANITINGGVTPSDINHWDTDENAVIGTDAAGNFHAGAGSLIGSYETHIGDNASGNAAIDGVDAKWFVTYKLRVGQSDIGSLSITGGAEMESQHSTTVGYDAGSSGSIVVSGSGSKLAGTTGDFIVGYSGHGSMQILNGGLVSHAGAFSICYPNATATQDGEVFVRDVGSTLIVDSNFIVARYGKGHLKIANGGQVTIGGTLGMNMAGTLNDGFVEMSNGGKLALYGNGSANIAAFFGLMNASGDNFIKYWNGSAWDDIANATVNVDYTLQYITSGDLTGYTLLTVIAEDEDECMYDIVGDFDGNCKVDFVDFATIAESWLLDCSYPSLLISPGCYD